MKNYKKLLAIFLCLSVAPSLFAQKIVGYIPGSYRDIAQMDAAIEWEKMTDYYYFGSYPTGAGDIVLESKEPGLGGLDHVVAKAALHGKNVWLSVGGWGKSSNFITVARSGTAMDAFCDKALQLCIDYGLTGIDIDWEFPSAGQEEDFRDFFKALYEKLNPAGYLVSAACGGESAHADKWLDATFDYIDDLNIMSYDDPSLTDGNHSSLQFMKDAMDLYYARGCPYEKMLGGVAFYSRCAGVIEYFNVLNGASDKQACYENDLTNSYCYNGKNTIVAKTDYVMNKGGIGILIWEVTQDALGQYSLLNACDEAMDPYRCAAPTPALGSDVSICGLSTVTLDGGVPQQAGVTFTWKKGATTLVDKSATANTYDASSTGTYTLEVWQGGCNRSDEIEATGVLNAPSLGGPYELCDPVAITLDAGVPGVGRTIEWQLNDVTLSGETASTLEVKKGGTYKVIVSASGCSSVNASATVTSEVPYADNDTVCTSGDVADFVASETVKWYDSETAPSELETGVTFNPTINANTTYWLGGAGSALTQYSTLGTSVGAGWNSGTSNYGRKITILADEVSIDAVSVTAASAGNIKLNLKSSDGNTIVKTTTTSISSGDQEVTLNWTGIAAGDYYLDAMGSGINLKIGNAAASSAFLIPDVFSSTAKGWANWGSWAESDNYGFFFNLKITAGKECKRVPVLAVIDASNPGCLSVGTSELSFENLKIYPNPSSAGFTVSGVEGDVQVFDLKGALVQEFNNISGVFTFGNNLDKGVYFVQFNANGNSRTEKIIKK